MRYTILTILILVERMDKKYLEERDGQPTEFENFFGTIYETFLIFLVYNYDFHAMEQVDKVMAYIFVSLYLVIVSCVCMNLYIALLSEAFARIHSEASVIASLNEAKALLSLERRFPTMKEDFDWYLFQHCSPMVSNDMCIFFYIYEKNATICRLCKKSLRGVCYISIKQSKSLAIVREKFPDDERRL